MSARASMARCPRACSGAMYEGVPTTIPVLVTSIEDQAVCTSPKSMILASSTRPPGRKMLAGLMSRCTRSCACTSTRASATRSPSVTLSCRESPARASRRRTSSPSSHSITR